jgi:CSLREA domain-containing protein
MTKTTLAAVATAAFLAIAAAPAAAQNFTVTKTADTNDGACDSDCSLREAINAANATAADDTVVVPAGTYTFTRSGTDDTGVNGDLDLGSTNPGLPRAITIQGAGAGQTIVDAAGVDRVFDLLRAMTATITGLTARGGTTTAYGGSVNTSIDASLTLDHVELTGGAAGSGGGLAVGSGTSATVRDSRIAGNSVTNGGGGIENSGTTTLLRDQIAGNHADSYRGGGIDHTSGTLTVTDTELSANSSAIGGGITVENGGPAILNNVAIVGNTASAVGAGLFNQYQVTATNTTIAGNVVTALGDGGGGIDAEATMSLHNVTVAGNSAPAGPALRAVVGSVTVQNSILAGGCSVIASGSIASAGNNISDGSSCGLTGPGDRPGVDPRLAPLAANGGPTRTLALLAGSPAIDAANPGACPATDQRGVTRPQGAGCDIGAYEYVPPPPTPPANPAPTPPRDTTAPTLKLTVGKTHYRTLRRNGRLKVTATVSEAAKIVLTLKRGKTKLGTATATAARAGKVRLTFKLSKSARKRVTSHKLTLTGTATDAARNVGRAKTTTVRLSA